VLSINEKREKRNRKIILFFDIIFLPNCFILSASVIFQCHYQPIFISTKALRPKYCFFPFTIHTLLFSLFAQSLIFSHSILTHLLSFFRKLFLPYSVISIFSLIFLSLIHYLNVVLHVIM
jgi:hypothetical protein